MMECTKLCRRPPLHTPTPTPQLFPSSLAPTPHSTEEIKELCSRRSRGEEGGDLERGAGGWGPGALELITE